MCRNACSESGAWDGTAVGFDGLALEGLVELWGLVTGPDTIHTLRITFLSRRRSDVQHSSYCPPSNLPTTLSPPPDTG